MGARPPRRRGNQYVWGQGEWLRERPGHDYRSAGWIERNGQWQRVGNPWERRGPNGDRDGDGIANHPGPALEPNGDLDRDGVRNARDRRPDDRRRS